MSRQNIDGTREAPFSAQEYDARLEAVRALAAKRGLDALIISDPANMYYLTGYDAWSFYMPQILFLPVDGPMYFIAREMDAHGAHRTIAVIPQDRILAYPERYIDQDEVHPGDWMAQAIRDLGYGTSRRVGYEGDTAFFTVRTFRSLEAGLPEWEFEDSRHLVGWVRLVKSDIEIDYMRKAGVVCQGAMEAALDGFTLDRPQNDVAADVMAAQARGSHGIDGDYTSIVPLFPMGAGADTPHLTWADVPTPSGVPISVELAGAHRRYHAPLARTAIIGKPDPDLDRLSKVTVEALEAALDTLRDGVPASEVAKAFTDVLGRHGYRKNSRLGYSIGVGYPPDWGERTVSIRAEDPTTLRTNMTFHLIAGMWLRGMGFEVSESIRVTDHGHETFSSVPRGLISLDSRR
ncbi:M24 family metallopeptidase [Kocuria massiliensis]|uniref:M24 family metallopeptidase n=1 Tax=Kocuria massiliensis TaxID=1926282 RepID=UPI000A1CA940|nr:M24 family metallopeptidase [Kocuria massiliensis]